eukprot:PhF_6_TR24930/c0_g1_i1/m.34315
MVQKLLLHPPPSSVLLIVLHLALDTVAVTISDIKQGTTNCNSIRFVCTGHVSCWLLLANFIRYIRQHRCDTYGHSVFFLALQIFDRGEYIRKMSHHIFETGCIFKSQRRVFPCWLYLVKDIRYLKFNTCDIYRSWFRCVLYGVDGVRHRSHRCDIIGDYFD